MIDRHERHSLSQCVTCADQINRHERHTPLGGVTIVTLVALSQFPITPSGTQWVQVVQRGANVVANVVPMRARCGRGAGSCFLSPKKSGENDG